MIFSWRQRKARTDLIADCSYETGGITIPRQKKSPALKTGDRDFLAVKNLE
jgi:hypothetical protein